MIRIILVGLALAAIVYLAIRIARDFRDADLDWRGLAVAAGLVMLAFYLRQITDIGGLV